MFLTPRNEPPYRPREDIQGVINNSSAANRPTNCCDDDELSTKPSSRDEYMESGRSGSGAGGGSTSSSPTSTSDRDHLMRVHTEAEPDQPNHGDIGFWTSRCLSVPFLLLVGVTASLVILPLVLPPLPPPPSMLMLVPVAMLLVLLALAFMPTTSGGRSGTNPNYL